MNPGLFEFSPLLAQARSGAALTTFLIYTLAVFGLAAASNRLLRSKSFLSEYFLGSRSLGVWAFALTFAATSSSGGSFTGFPSKIYTHGWVLGLWIGSYLVVPILAMGLLGKRINHVSRISGSITIPDVLRDRFDSAAFGLLSVSMIVFFMSFNLVAQFKAGSEILKTLLQDVDTFQQGVAWVAGVTSSRGILPDVDPAYLLCLVTFAVAVVSYTTYGGFHAVVWTDVMQGIVMGAGVLLMLPLAIWQVGGLVSATEQIARMTPPRLGLANIELEVPLEENVAVSSPWFVLPGEDVAHPRLFRVSRTLAIPAHQRVVEHVKVVEITTPEEIERQLQRLSEANEIARIDETLRTLPETQIAWLDRSPHLKGARVTLTLSKQYRFGDQRRGVYVTGPGPDPPSLPRYPGTLIVDVGEADAEIQVYDQNGTLEVTRHSGEPKVVIALERGGHRLRVSSPGFAVFAEEVAIEAGDTRTVQVDLDRSGNSTAVDDFPSQQAAAFSTGFLPLSLAISFFFMWGVSGAGQPSTMVRLMAFRNSATLRRGIFTVAIYYSMIYFPLVIIFCCARVMLPGMDLESDSIMPQMAVTLTENIGQGWLAGLLIAAPFAAVMSTVDSFLLLISSALVRDIYQRNINPKVSERTIRRMSYLFTLLVGAGATLGAVNPPQFLQDIIVYTGSGLAACFLGPMVFALYFPRANAIGCMSGMVAGFAAHLGMYVGGIFVNGSFFKPFRLLDFNPIIIGLFVSFATAYVAIHLTPPPPRKLVEKYFYRRV